MLIQTNTKKRSCNKLPLQLVPKTATFLPILILLVTATLSAGNPEIITAVGDSFYRNGIRFEVKGVNYFAKDYSWDLFWTNYGEPETAAQIDQELSLAKEMGCNTVRVFVPYGLFSSGEKEYYLSCLTNFVNALAARNMVCLVTLFDFYASEGADSYLESDYVACKAYLADIINEIGNDNPAVFAWDVKNELDRDYERFGKGTVQTWAQEMISAIRLLDPNHLITIGFFGEVTGTPCFDPGITDAPVFDPFILHELSSVVDFVSMHYFLSERCFEQDLVDLKLLTGDKPIVLEEFGIHTMSAPPISCDDHPDNPACDDPHTEAEQAAYFNAILSLGEAYGVAGYLFWTLADFRYVPENWQASHHCQGVLRNSLVTVCEAGSCSDYSRKPAAARVAHHFDNQAWYLDDFSGWVDVATMDPPAGWNHNLDPTLPGSGGQLRGYNPGSTDIWFSRQPGAVAFSKYGTSVNGLALSPVLSNLDISRYPFLAGQVFSYGKRDETYGSDCILRVALTDQSETIPLQEFTPATLLPATFCIDLRTALPTSWHEKENIQITLELISVAPGNGYSATYELGWIGLYAAVFGDNDGDEDVDGYDLATFASLLSRQSLGADLNKDDVMDADDIALFGLYFGR